MLFMKVIITLINEKIVSKAGNKLYETRRSFNLTPMARLSIDVTFEKVHIGARPEREIWLWLLGWMWRGGGSSPSLNRSHVAVRWQTATVNRERTPKITFPHHITDS